MTRSPFDQLEVLYREHFGVVFGTAWKVLRQKDDCDDVAQRVFLRVWQGLEASEYANVASWPKLLSGIAHNLAMETLRERQPHAELDERSGESAVGTTTTEVAWDLLAAVGAGLTDAQKVVFELSHRGFTDGEIGNQVGLSESSVAKIRKRAVLALTRGVTEQIGHRPGLAAECRALAAAIWESVGAKDRDPAVDDHLSSCAACKETQAQMAEVRRYAALLPLLPSKEKRSQMLRTTFVAARAPREGPRWRIAIALLLLLGIPGVVSDQPVLMPHAELDVHTQAAATTTRPPDVVPTPALAPSPNATARPVASPVPPSYVSPCPPGASGAYAYLRNGEVYYRSSLAAAPSRLTATGGNVDNFWWSPDGQRLAYKVPASPPAIRGDIKVISIASRAVVWDLQGSVDFFAFSPDGRQWAGGNIDVQNGILQGIDVLVAPFPSSAAQAQTFTAQDSDGAWGNPPTPVLFDWPAYQDQPPLLESSMRPDAGIFWETTGIYEHLNGPDHLYSSSGAYLAMGNVDSRLMGQFQNFPSTSAFTFAPSDAITRSCAGKVFGVYQPDLMGRAMQMTVDGPGRTALISVHDGGFTVDVVRLYADGRTLYLSSDGVTELPRWQP